MTEQLEKKRLENESRIKCGCTQCLSELDEDGFIEAPEHHFDRTPIPYISTLENQKHEGCFGKHYVCIGINGERWLVEKSIFEQTYEEVI